MPKILLEICVDDADGFIAAVAGGADRIELCSALELGGLTPTPGMISQASSSARASFPIPVYAMIRPRSGDFTYSEMELQSMEADIDAVQQAGLSGVVFGANNADGTLDEVALERLMQRAKRYGLGTTLHRSFDLVPDLGDAIETAIKLGFERILTSGRAVQAMPDGLADIEECVRLASGRIGIMPGAGLQPENVHKLFEAIPEGIIREVHSSCSIMQEISAENLIKFGFVAKNGKRRTSEEEVARFKNKLMEIA